jgi:hypothetical protein
MIFFKRTDPYRSLIRRLQGIVHNRRVICIPEHFESEPGLPTNFTRRAGVGRDLEAREFFFVRARPEMMFLVLLHYKMCGRPAPKPGPKTEARHVPWDGHGQDFLSPKNFGFFGPARGMLRSTHRVNT